MKSSVLVKIFAAIAVLLTGLIGFSFSIKSELQTLRTENTPDEIINASAEITGYKNWTKVNEKPDQVISRLAIMCAAPLQVEIDKESKNPHNDKYINVFVNDIGKQEMMTKKSPKFPVGTVIVKEKLTTSESTEPELLTVMIKREKNYNPEVGDWEFLTFNGAGTKTTARGQLQTCQACHLVEKRTDYVSRKYLPLEIREKLK